MVVSLEEFGAALDRNDVDTLLETVSECNEAFLDQLLHSDRKYFHEICQLGHSCVVEILLSRRNIDLEEEWEQKTPLQIAAANGHADLVSLLLCHGADYHRNIWKEDSPFYIATVMGHVEVLKKLTDHRPSVVKSEEARSSLILAACSRGNLEVLRFWMTPCTNLNEPKENVRSLDGCENLVPLWEACSGNHLEVATFLVSMGAIITKNICTAFPEITAKLVSNCFQKTANNKYQLSMANMKLEAVHPFWFSDHLTNLTRIDLSHNELTSLPQCIPWSMPLLTHLNVSDNKLEQFAGPENKENFHQVLRLTKVNLSMNRLESVCIELFLLSSLKKLKMSHNRFTQQIKIITDQRQRKRSNEYEEAGDGQEVGWLPSLTHLDISHNALMMIPSEIRSCCSLQHLILNNNRLCAFPSPWACRMQYLDVSNNCLETQRFMVSAEEFWSDSLKIFKINNNDLDEICESIVKLSELNELDASHNRIEHLPDVSSWECRHLNSLDLAHNRLGAPLTSEQINNTQKKSRSLANMLTWMSSGQENKKILELPQFLGDSLQYLNLSNNNLNSIPDSVSNLYNIIQLDLSGNPLIKVLPKQMGLLRRCVILELDGTGIPENVLKDKKPADLIRELKMSWRQSECCNKIKVVVMGPKEKGKSSLIKLLKGDRQEVASENNISVHQWKYSPSILKKNNPEITFNIWEIPGDKTEMQSCFLTPNALYIIAFDLRAGRKGVRQLSEWLCAIQNTVPGSFVVLVGTFLDKISLDERAEKMQEINEEITYQYINTHNEGDCPVILCTYFLSCISTDSVSELRKLIYDKAKVVKDLFYQKQTVIERKIPKSYIVLEEKLVKKLKELESKELPPILHEQDLQELFDSIPNDDIRILKDQDNAIQYLVEIGKILHFNDQLEDLNSIYFLTPVYLQELLSLVLSDREDMPQHAEISISQIKQCFERQNYPTEFFPQYIQILKKFEIVLDMQGKKLMVPSKLPRQPPMFQADKCSNSSKICRLYYLPYIPSGLWTKLIIRVLQATQRFCHSRWFLGGRSLRDHDRKFSRKKSVYGFHIKERAVTYWREGIHLIHETGTILVESVKCRLADTTELGKGILITVSSTNTDFSVMGIIVDELDDILQEYFPGFQDFIMEMPAIYSVCPLCFENIKDDSDAVVQVDHFHVKVCAAAAFTVNEIDCPNQHSISLHKLVPEMLFRELPHRFQLDHTKMEFDQVLGSGAGGYVYKGKYDGKMVAYKVFHFFRPLMLQLPSEDSGSGTWNSTVATDDSVYENVILEGQFNQKNPFCSKDKLETKALKAYRAFTEFRREISVMSKLRHPCIISFLGLSIINHLVLTMELAAEGSLRSVLNNKRQNQSFNKYRDKEKIFKPVLEKNITYKIIYQIAKGLQYLHDHSVIYRDLKTDNILICSLDVNDAINAKLTDYGISKFSTTQGLVGFKGTMGYMAPEIMCNFTYNEKVDIFSFAMVMSEIVTGHLPFEKCSNLAQLHQTIIKEKQRPCVQDFNIVSHFPYLERLMSECWHHEANKRPSAETIATKMHNTSFLCQHEVIRPGNNQKYFGKITSMASASESLSTKKNFLWFWEMGKDKSERTYSIFDLETSQFHVFQNPCHGNEVTCMTKVGRDMWIGTQASEVEIISCQNTGVPRSTEQFKQEGIPVSILHVHKKNKGSEDDQDLGSVYLGLSTGVLVIYTHEPNSYGKVTETWKKSAVAILSVRKAVTSLTHIETKSEVWVACGQHIYIFCTTALTMKMSLDIFKNDTLGNIFGKNPVIKEIVCSGTRVWCMFRNQLKFVELDLELTEPTYIVYVKKDRVFCKYLGDDSNDKDDVGNEEESSDDDDDDGDEDDDDNDDDNDTEGLSQTWPKMRHSSKRALRDNLDSELYLKPFPKKCDNIPDYLTMLPPDDGTCSMTESSSVDSEKGHIESTAVNIYEPVYVGAQLSHDGVNVVERSNSDADDKSATTGTEKQLVKQMQSRLKIKSNTPGEQPGTETETKNTKAKHFPPIPPKRRAQFASLSDISLNMGSETVNTKPIPQPRGVKQVSALKDAPPVPPRQTSRSEVSRETDTVVTPPLPPRYTKTSNSDKPPPLPSRSVTVSESLLSVNHPSAFNSVLKNSPKTFPEQNINKKKSATLSQAVKKVLTKETEKNSKSTFWDVAPPVPPRLPPRRQQSVPKPEDDKKDFSKDGSASQTKTKKKKTKESISSLLVVEDTLWISTSLGNMKILSQEMCTSGGQSLKLCELKCVTSEDKCEVPGPQPVTQMVRAKDLVVSLRKLTGDPVSHLSQMTVWRAYSSADVKIVEGYWSSLEEEELKYTHTDSLA